jgi:hypothetical protein
MSSSSSSLNLPNAPKLVRRSYSEIGEGAESGSLSTGSVRRIQSTPHLSEIPVGLLVEDEYISGKAEQTVLQKAFGGKFDIASNFRAAQEKLQEKVYRFLVTDHNLSSGDAAKPENKAHYEAERTKLFPRGLAPGLAEGYVLLDYVNKLPADRKPQHTLLISAVEGITKDELENSVKSLGASFLKKPISVAEINRIAQSWFTSPHPTPPITLPQETTGTQPPGEQSTAPGVLLHNPPLTLGIPEGKNNEGEGQGGEVDAEKSRQSTPLSGIENPFRTISLHDTSSSSRPPGESMEERKSKKGDPSDPDKEITSAGGERIELLEGDANPEGGSQVTDITKLQGLPSRPRKDQKA